MTTIDARRRAAALRLRAEAEAGAEAREAATAEAATATSGGDTAAQQLAALRRRTGSEHVAPVALAYLKIRFPALLRSAPPPGKRARAVERAGAAPKADGAEAASHNKKKR